MIPWKILSGIFRHRPLILFFFLLPLPLQSMHIANLPVLLTLHSGHHYYLPKIRACIQNNQVKNPRTKSTFLRVDSKRVHSFHRYSAVFMKKDGFPRIFQKESALYRNSYKWVNSKSGKWIQKELTRNKSVYQPTILQKVFMNTVKKSWLIDFDSFSHFFVLNTGPGEELKQADLQDQTVLGRGRKQQQTSSQNNRNWANFPRKLT